MRLILGVGDTRLDMMKLLYPTVFFFKDLKFTKIESN